MTWVKLDDQFFSHPKACAAGKDGRALFLAGLCYCAGYLTDGFIPTQALSLLATQAGVRRGVAQKLVDVGFWAPVEEGWWVHDFLERNPSKAKVEKDRAAARERAAKGGRSSPEVQERFGSIDPVPSLSEPNGSEQPPKKRKPNPLFDALTDVFGPATPRARASLYGSVAASLKEAGATPEEIVTRGRRMLTLGWDTPGPKALETHWPELANGKRPADPSDDAPGAHHCETCGELDFLPGSGKMACACPRV